MVLLSAEEIEIILLSEEIETAIKTESADATFAGDTSELPAGTRCITIPLADELETRLVLYFLPVTPDGSSKKEWTAGFYIERRYDTEPYDAVHEERPGPDPAEEYCYAWLGDAVLWALGRAAWWLSANSNTDEYDGRWSATNSAIEAWKDEFSAETASESIFDDASGEEVNAAADCPAAEGELEQLTTGRESQKEIHEETPSPAGAASVQYQNKKTHLEQIISKTVMDQIRLKSALKQCNESLRTYGDELAELESAWNKPLPLFDGQPAATAGDQTPSQSTKNTDDVPPAAVESVDAQFPWRTKKISDLENLTPKIVEILELENIRTVGEWVDWPVNHPGIEYTQISNSAGKLTEKRYDKLVAAMDGVIVFG